MNEYMIINKKDNVAVALKKIEKGFCVQWEGKNVELQEEIPQGHKFLIKDVKKGEDIIKYGNPIGHATEDLQAGAWIHIHNMKTNLGELLEYEYHPAEEILEKTEHRFFQGYRRTDGTVGVRNEIWIIPTVGCVNNVASLIAEKAKVYQTGNIDGITAFPHPYGCSQMGEDQEYTRTILADLVRHPNAGGVLVLGLGCENSGIEILKNYIGGDDEQRGRFLKRKGGEEGGEEDLKNIKELAGFANKF